MTETARQPVALPTGFRTDLARVARLALAAALPVGPLAVALLRYLMPYSTTDDAATMVSRVYAHPGAQNALLWLGLLAILTLVPGVYAVTALLRPRAPRLAVVAAVLLVPAYLALGLMIASDYLLGAAAQVGLPQADAIRLLGGMHPTAAVATGIFVVGHVVGTVLLGVACWRTVIVPVVVAVGLTVSQPLHFVAAVVLGSHLLDLVAWGLTALGMAALAMVLVRAPQRD
ncbi:MAG: hypothetical protein ACR2FG_04000 [Marmoricola sp.]